MGILENAEHHSRCFGHFNMSEALFSRKSHINFTAKRITRSLTIVCKKETDVSIKYYFYLKLTFRFTTSKDHFLEYNHTALADGLWKL